MSNNPTEESFLKNVAEHQMTVLMDNGIYRHLRFSRPQSSNMYFELITGPGFLLYRGDMGCYEFERLADMFEFFRTNRNSAEKQGKRLYINKGHWAEKVEAASKFGNGVKGFSEERFRKVIISQAKDFAKERELSGSVLEIFNDQIENMISAVGSEHEAYEAMQNMEFDSIEISDDEILEFSAEDVFGGDLYEYNFEEPTYHYIWCCYAIAWGIRQYDNFKDGEK